MIYIPSRNLSTGPWTPITVSVATMEAEIATKRFLGDYLIYIG
jgi:hypothetical protein